MLVLADLLDLGHPGLDDQFEGGRGGDQREEDQVRVEEPVDQNREEELQSFHNVEGADQVEKEFGQDLVLGE